MTLRKWFHLFWTTLLVGILLGIIAGLILKFSDRNFTMPGLSDVGLNLFYMLLVGATISLLSQMGYFAYLIVRYIGLGIIRNRTLWDFIQVLLIIIALFELVFLRTISFDGSWVSYLPLAVIVLVVSLLTAYWKVKLTNRNGFLPTLFYMSVVTILEAIPALRANNSYGTFFMLLPLIGCNAWQILILPRVLAVKRS